LYSTWESPDSEEVSTYMSIFPTKVLLATDGSMEAQLAAKSALGLAQQTGSELHVLHVLALPLDTRDPSSFEPEVRRQLEERASARVDELVGRIEAQGGEVAGTHLGVGRPDAEIIDQAEVIGAGLIVMGSRGLGPLRRALTGSVSDSVLRHAHCPVMVVRGEAVVFPTKILLATDGSEEANLASSTAADLARGTGSELHIVYVEPATYVFEMEEWEASRADMRDELERAAGEVADSRLQEQLRKIGETDAQIAGTYARVGFPDAEIVALAGKLGVRLIVMGSRGRGPLKRALMGSVSDSVVRHASCPILVVRTER
jgi:nucleotide-binding universal stress UspA family protein